MPYLLVSTQIRMEVGPTMVGDEFSDKELMGYLGATKRHVLGNLFWEYYVNDPPRIVLDKLEARGYRVAHTRPGEVPVYQLPHPPEPLVCAECHTCFLICRVSPASMYGLHSNPRQSGTEVPIC